MHDKPALNYYGGSLTQEALSRYICHILRDIGQHKTEGPLQDQ